MLVYILSIVRQYKIHFILITCIFRQACFRLLGVVYLECSAKTGEGVDDIFIKIATALRGQSSLKNISALEKDKDKENKDKDKDKCCIS